jgi:hypothetical protein
VKLCGPPKSWSAENRACEWLDLTISRVLSADTPNVRRNSSMDGV